MLRFKDVPILWVSEQNGKLHELGISTETDFESFKIFRFAYASGICEGRDLEAENFNLAQMPNRSKND